MEITNISLIEIDFSDHTFRMIPFADGDVEDNLLQSLRKVGMLHPPIIQKRPDSAYVIVAGRKRLQAARDHLNFSSVNCLLLPQNKDELQVWAIAIEETLQTRTLTPVELSVFLNKINILINKREVAQRFLPALGLSLQVYQIDKLLPFASLEEPLARALHFGTLDHKAALQLCNLSFCDRMILFEVINKLRLSISNQKKLITTCITLTKRNSVSINTILSDPAVQEIIDSTANIPQKTIHLMKWLHCQSFPQLAEAEKEFHTFASRLGLPKWASVTHTTSFETDAIRLSFEFNNQEDCRQFWQKTHSVVDDYNL